MDNDYANPVRADEARTIEDGSAFGYTHVFSGYRGQALPIVTRHPHHQRADVAQVAVHRRRARAGRRPVHAAHICGRLPEGARGDRGSHEGGPHGEEG